MKNQGLSRGESKTKRNAAQSALWDTSRDGARAATPGSVPHQEQHPHVPGTGE